MFVLLSQTNVNNTQINLHSPINGHKVSFDITMKPNLNSSLEVSKPTPRIGRCGPRTHQIWLGRIHESAGGFFPHIMDSFSRYLPITPTNLRIIDVCLWRQYESILSVYVFILLILTRIMPENETFYSISFGKYFRKGLGLTKRLPRHIFCDWVWWLIEFSYFCSRCNQNRVYFIY